MGDTRSSSTGVSFFSEPLRDNTFSRSEGDRDALFKDTVRRISDGRIGMLSLG